MILCVYVFLIDKNIKWSEQLTESKEFSLLKYWLQRDEGFLVGSNGVLNPGNIVADLGVHTREILLGTAIAPGDNVLELSTSDYKATIVTLG